MMAAEKKLRSQLNVMITKETRRDLNTVMIRGDVGTQADAVALAFRIAVKHLTERKEIDE